MSRALPCSGTMSCRQKTRFDWARVSQVGNIGSVTGISRFVFHYVPKWFVISRLCDIRLTRPTIIYKIAVRNCIVKQRYPGSMNINLRLYRTTNGISIMYVYRLNLFSYMWIIYNVCCTNARIPIDSLFPSTNVQPWRLVPTNYGFIHANQCYGIN